MKKVILPLIAIFLLISGCKSDKKDPVENIVFKEKIVGIENLTSKEFKDDFFNVYYVNNELIFYFELNEYVENMENMLEDDIQITEGEIFKIARLDEDDGESYEITFDFENNEITMDSISIADFYFKSSDSGEEFLKVYETYFEDQDDDEKYNIVTDNNEIVYKLSDYDIKMYQKDGKYYVPFHVLQFVLSEYETKLVYNGSEFLYYESFSTTEEAKVTNHIKNVELDKEVIEYNANFTKMIMENFYGLKNYNKDYLDGIEAINDANKPFDSFRTYLANLNDLHSSVSENFYKKDDQLNANEVRNFSKLGSNLQEAKCDFNKIGTEDEEVEIIKLSDDTVLLDVVSFSSPNFATGYFKALDEVRGYKNIVLDLSCNLGGYAGNTNLFAYPFTNEDVMSYSGDVTGLQLEIAAKKKSETELFDSEIYVLTSAASFSAGNYAPIMFSDMNLGKIIGQKSGGGTAAVEIVLMPNGMLLSLSSGGHLLLDKDFNYVEDGADVDIEIDFKQVANKKELHNLILEKIE